ncbi:hypothetical protein [Pseudoalteromonas denitrificans]|jgi:hypothetical protein|uniref:Uncharacterized protein n=1 Tax=Pseudoalteromonas denitrificans DSM 6059 TaxID=1123010 RepID=A0A1I1JAN8_9GAMM|nr:hypothetical protein [Pseudoalteromonas denitrificans]SFC43003.1 hypothetical protein SAMN02745724_01639 [Pseudoalteromonas denitrificans DSM 6059]
MLDRGYQKADYLMPNNSLVKQVFSGDWEDLNIDVNFYYSIREYLTKYPEYNHVENWIK